MKGLFLKIALIELKGLNGEGHLPDLDA